VLKREKDEIHTVSDNGCPSWTSGEYCGDSLPKDIGISYKIHVTVNYNMPV
jgi:hypothetical protein